MQEHILAWARDRRSGRLRYIMELGELERGSACNCICVSCNQPLVAVNAAKFKWERRPHFRHESGTGAHSCQVMAARAALLASLQSADLIILPRLRRSVSIVGLSGAIYEGWVEIAPQRVRIGDVHFTDTTSAEVLLEDGRRLQVLVTGTASSVGSGAGEGKTLQPRIEIYIDDPALSTMSPEELRARLVPALEGAAWCGHWPDAAGDKAARNDALRAADNALDWNPDADELPADLRRESLLHREVKAILAQASSVLLPVWLQRSTGEIVTNSTRTTRVQLIGARLEQKLGRIIPDVIAETQADGELLVEVTVTNTITGERLERIRAVNLATVEINFSQMAGLVSRETLRHLVLDQVTGKTWLHHPAAGTPLAIADAGELAPDPTPVAGFADAAIPQVGDAAKRKAALLAIPVANWANRYLDTVRELARIDFELAHGPTLGREAAHASVLAAADGLYLHGYPEALDYRLFDNQRTMLHRLMSIMNGYPVAYRYVKVWQVINSILTDVSAEAKSWHGLYLLALQESEHRLNFTNRQRELLDEWRSRVRTSLRQNEDEYRRDPRYDRLFSLLFPELAVGLENLRLKRAFVAKAATPRTTDVDPDLIDLHFYDERGYDQWTWSMPTSVVVREIELAASTARIEGWGAGERRILDQLSRERFSINSDVWVTVSIVAIKLDAGPELLLRYLCYNGYIMLK